MLGEAAVLLDDVPAANIHNGSRVRFGPDGALYVTFGDVAAPSVAQDLGSLNGKILRLADDGTTPAGNPFGSPVWSWGHRNPQGIDWHPVTGDLFETEHGATGNDEINVIDRGRNYGWPIIEGDAVAAGHADADHVLRAGGRAVGRVLLPRHGVPGVPQRPVRRHASRAGAAARPARPRESAPRAVDRAAPREPLRPPARCGQRARRVPVHRDEQPRRARRAGVGRRSDPDGSYR